MASSDNMENERKYVELKVGMEVHSEDEAYIGYIKISHFNDEHNHEFAVPEERKFLRINRNIGPASAGVVNEIHFHGIRWTDHLSKESGGSGNVGFMQRDYQSSVSHQKKPNLIERGDAQSLINHFSHCQIEDQKFFHHVELDEEGRLANFFLRDGRSKLDYDYFGDVVIFDTFRTSKYDMIFAPFVGVNHQRKNIFFGCGFLLNETIDSFVSLFETLLERMGNQPPKTIFANQCQVMENAIKKVFPNTCHRLCLWHISKDAFLKIASLYANSDFKSLFHECLNSETEDELQSTWAEMILRFDLVGNKWLESLYQLRKKWCPAFSLATSTPFFSSAQRTAADAKLVKSDEVLARMLQLIMEGPMQTNTINVGMSKYHMEKRNDLLLHHKRNPEVGKAVTGSVVSGITGPAATLTVEPH
ncbi:protein FAR1-RELATED SEQUENCE 5-like [Cornus florida]|uniref:protein FAR1-RELATED SEQUENCE 5-like n=1 Tax=Cornus florida TaxID=4283 RepID=UPI002896F59D|nr:protein FAR1-RELATED SEQUENCE 5-like [Cornus florida]